jgi:hypothetical protein
MTGKKRKKEVGSGIIPTHAKAHAKVGHNTNMDITIDAQDSVLKVDVGGRSWSPVEATREPIIEYLKNIRDINVPIEERLKESLTVYGTEESNQRN